MHDDLTALVTRAGNGDQAGVGRTRRPVRPADLVHLPQIPAGPGRCRGRRPERVAAAGGPAWVPSRSGRASRLARHYHPAGMRPGPARSAETAGSRTCRTPRNPGRVTAAAESELLRAERHAALREAFTHLPPDSRRLIALLIQDPPVPYAEISAKLGIPVGSIGPSRSRCLEKLRRDPAIAALINAEAQNAGAELDIQPGRPVSPAHGPGRSGPGSGRTRLHIAIDRGSGLGPEANAAGPRLLEDGLPCIFTAREVQIKPPCPPVGQVVRDLLRARHGRAPTARGPLSTTAAAATSTTAAPSTTTAAPIN